MRTASTLALCTLVGTAAAFSNTHPVIAWSNQQLSTLSLLSTPPTSRTPFRPSPADQLPLGSSPEATSDLCSLQSLILLSAPGLHISDLAFLPSSSSSPTGIRASLAHAKKHGQAVEQPYIPARLAGQSLKMVQRFVEECGATVVEEREQEERGIWNGEEKTTVRVVEVQGLEEWELVGKGARAGRKEVVARIDAALTPLLTTLTRTGAPHAIILTSLPSSSLSSLKRASSPKLTKRQYDGDYAYTETSAQLAQEETEEAELLEELEAVAQNFGASIDYAAEPVASSVIGVSAWASKANQTSIFAVKPNSGLLHRYVFFTPALIFALLISLLLLIPIVLIGSTALQSVETVQGLEGKMLGGVAVDQAKSG